MRILYVSSLPETMSGGPKHSVPKQVNAQAKYDQVKWINISRWGAETSNVPCEMIEDYRLIKNSLIQFNPELVIFEDFQYFMFVRIATLLRKKGYPYIIVPRGCMTTAAQRHKALKKEIANLLFLNRFARKALAIEYLTTNEEKNASKSWNKNSIIVPNGTDIHNETKELFNMNSLVGTFIGRINPYHKGIDQFLLACNDLSELIRKKNISMHFYGPAEIGVREELEKQIIQYGLQDNIHLHKEVHGEEKDKVLRASDFFILTSRFEGMPMGLIEALAYGLPVLVTEETNMGDVIDKWKAGFVSQCERIGIRNNLNRLLNNSEEEFKRMSLNALSLAKKYDWINIAERTHGQYLELLGMEE